MKKLIIGLFCAIGICLLLTFIILFWETKYPKAFENTGKSIEKVYENAYITACSGGNIVFVYNGEEYRYKGALRKDYTGPANIKIKNDTIAKVYAIIERATKIDKTDEADEADKEDTSYASNIRVLLKNKDKIYYKKVHLKTSNDLVINDINYGNDIIASDIFEDIEEKEIYIKNERYIIFNKKKYEGDFLIKKYKKGYVVINILPIETYLKYVLPSEMPISFSYEALKAQAVCARTVAYTQIGDMTYADYGADLDDSTAFQVYNSGGSYEITNKAVEDTKGLIITHQNKPINCYYFSTSAGKTSMMDIWGLKTPKYIKSVKSKDDNSVYYKWKAKINIEGIESEEYGKLRRIKILKKNKSGYVLSLKAKYENGSIVYKNEYEIRQFLGQGHIELTLSDGTVKDGVASIPSACFDITKKSKNSYIIKGGGFGHGIGMSQYGADKLASKGKTFEEIINYYYKKIEIQDVSKLY